MCRRNKFINILICVFIMAKSILPFFSLPTDKCLEDERMTLLKKGQEIIPESVCVLGDLANFSKLLSNSSET